VGALIMLAPLPARADDPPPGWSGKGQLGYLMSRGNSDSDSANAKLDALDVAGPWKHELNLNALYGKSSQVVSAERWDARLQSNYQITERLFTFGALTYEHDMFSGFQYQASGTAGMGYKFINTGATTLSAQVGVGYRSLRPETLLHDNPTNGDEVTGRVPLDRSSEAVGTGGIDFSHAFNANTKLTDKFIGQSGSDNTSLENDLALEVKMSKKLALAAGFTLRDNTNPPAGLKKKDTATTLNLVYAF
jgi:putative salt-induced outer membrane protein